MKPDLRNFSFEELEQLLHDLGEPAFRAHQIFQWLHLKGLDSFEGMTNIPVDLRQKLTRAYQIQSLKLLKLAESIDGTGKFLWQLTDGEKIESVLLNDGGRRTLCLSTQVGCKMGCTFCATAQIKFKRNLTTGEIISQLIDAEKISGLKISNLVYMGMGEPLDNYENVIKSIKILNHPEGKNIGLRKITLSTCGLIPQINRLSREKLAFRLAVSLNASGGGKRRQIMPISRKFPLPELLESLKRYTAAGGPLTLEYVLIKDFNDSPEDARKMVSLARGLRTNINLIAFNKFPGTRYQSPTAEKIKNFKKILINAGLAVSQRYKRGENIGAACGQLTANYEK
jgi:23S rRNA (adenine2503-C2)-methyltransferase